MTSPLDTLKQLKEMLDAGTITPQEFEALKQQLVFGPAAPTAPGVPAAPEPQLPVVAAPVHSAGADVAVPEATAPTLGLGQPAEPPLSLTPASPPPAATPVPPPPAAPTETPEWMAAAAPMLLSGHEGTAPAADVARRNPLTLVFAVGGALVLLALVLYLALDNKHDSERLTSATQTAADSTAVVPEVGPQSEQITLPPATAPDTVRVAPATPPPVAPAAATKFSSGATTTTTTHDTASVPQGKMEMAADSTKKM